LKLPVEKRAAFDAEAEKRGWLCSTQSHVKSSDWQTLVYVVAEQPEEYQPPKKQRKSK
jgi:hypothetical protein